MSTTDSSTHCCASELKIEFAKLLHGWFTALLLSLFVFIAVSPANAQNDTDVSNLRLEQTQDGMYLSATMRFELPGVIEDALLKGIAMTFVAEAQLRRDRWYWYDKNVVTTSRSVRLSFQPLTRRWRVSTNSGGAESGSSASLSQSFDQLPDALAVVRRLSRWKIAEAAEIDLGSRHNVDFRFRLDTAQLPRPMQIGITGNTDWNISLQRNLRPEAR